MCIRDRLIDYQNISLPFGVRNYTLDTAKYKTGVYIINIKGATVDQSIQVSKNKYEKNCITFWKFNFTVE